MVYSSFKTASYDWSHVNSPKIRILNRRVYLWKGVDVSFFPSCWPCVRGQKLVPQSSHHRTLIASIITFSKKKKFGKKNVTLYPRHGTLALDMKPSTLDPRQKDRLTGTGLTLIILIVFAFTTSKVSLFFHVNLLSRLRYSPFSCSQLSKISARI